MAYPRLTIPRAEADTFAASAAINEAVEAGYLTQGVAGLIKNNGSRIACDLLSGKTILTINDQGDYVEVVLAEEPATGDRE